MTSALQYQTPLIGNGIEVPKGFITDFASVPRIPVVYSLTGNTAHDAAVVHDYLYQTHIISKKLADKIFLEAMKVMKVPRWRRWVMYYTVRVAGGPSYKSGPDRLRILRAEGEESA